MVKLRLDPAARAGPPNAPFALRVSATRHGVTGTKRKAGGADTVIATEAGLTIPVNALVVSVTVALIIGVLAVA
jgi:hypothetical protein